MTAQICNTAIVTAAAAADLPNTTDFRVTASCTTITTRSGTNAVSRLDDDFEVPGSSSTPSWRPCLPPVLGPGTIRHSDGRRRYASSFGSVKAAFNLKKLKLSLSPSPQWPQAALWLGGDGRQVPEADQGQDRLWT